MKLQQEGQALPSLTLVRNVHVRQLKIFTILHIHMSMIDQRSAANIDFWVPFCLIL